MGSWKRSGSVDGHGDGSLNAFWDVTDWVVLKQSWDEVWNIEYLLGIYTDGKERKEAGFGGRKIQTTVNAWQSLNQPQRELWCLYATTTPIPPKQTLDLSFLWRGVLLLLRDFAGTDCRIHLLTASSPSSGGNGSFLEGECGWYISMSFFTKRQVKLVLESEEGQWN